MHPETRISRSGMVQRAFTEPTVVLLSSVSLIASAVCSGDEIVCRRLNIQHKRLTQCLRVLPFEEQTVAHIVSASVDQSRGQKD